MKKTTKEESTIPFFRLTMQIGEDSYLIVPIEPPPPDSFRAFHLKKLTGNRNTYRVRDTFDGCRCDCPGFCRWKRCKHITTLKAARILYW